MHEVNAPFTPAKLMVGATIQASDDVPEHLGTITRLHAHTVDAVYKTLDDMVFSVDYDDIVKAWLPEAPQVSLPPLPPKPSSDNTEAAAPSAPAVPVPASRPMESTSNSKPKFKDMTVEDMVVQRFIAPGRVVTWSKAASFGYHVDRMFVILNFTRGAGMKEVNIAPLNGLHDHESNINPVDWYRVSIKNVMPMRFPAPLVKRVNK